MPINLPGIPIQPVPVGQVPGVIPQIPPHMDPSSIIMQMAQLRQQSDLAQQEMQQKSFENITQAIHAAAALQEQKRHSKSEEQMAKITQGIALEKLEPEKVLMAAHAAYYNISAGENLKDVIDAHLTRVRDGLETPDQFQSFMSRIPQGAKLQALKIIAESNVNLKKPALQYGGEMAAQKTQFGPSIQMPLKMSTALLPALNLLDHLSDHLPRTDIQAFNQGGLALMKKTGSVAAQALATQTNNVVQTFQQQFGKGSDQKLAADFDSLNSAQSPAQFKIAVALTKADVIAKRNVLGNYAPDYKTQYDDAIAPMPKFSTKQYLQSLGAGYSHDDAVQSLMTARQAGLISD